MSYRQPSVLRPHRLSDRWLGFRRIIDRIPVWATINDSAAPIAGLIINNLQPLDVGGC